MRVARDPRQRTALVWGTIRPKRRGILSGAFNRAYVEGLTRAGQAYVAEGACRRFLIVETQTTIQLAIEPLSPAEITARYEAEHGPVTAPQTDGAA